MVEQTLVLIKPDGVMKRVVAEIKQRYLDAGLRIVQERTIVMPEFRVREFYAEHTGKSFFEGLVLSMTSGPIVALVLEGEDAIKKVRALNGATDPSKAEPGTIRGDFRSAGGPFNMVHGSDSPEAVIREIQIAFSGTF